MATEEKKKVGKDNLENKEPKIEEISKKSPAEDKKAEPAVSPEVEESAIEGAVADEGIDLDTIPDAEEVIEAEKPKRARRYDDEDTEVEWSPKTQLGKMVKAGEIGMNEIFSTHHQIRESEIVDFLLPGIEEITMLIGGSPGKGGGIQRRPSRRTVRVHKSGRRTKTSMMTIVGDTKGYLGIGVGKAATNKAARDKSLKNAKLALFPIRKGCGSWECSCGDGHSIPYAIAGKCGSVEVKLMPAPRGLGLCASDEMKKIFQIIGIKDVRLKSRGQTHSRINFIFAIEDALKNINRMKF
jgi:small subunit ribosomal protein S5